MQSILPRALFTNRRKPAILLLLQRWSGQSGLLACP